MDALSDVHTCQQGKIKNLRTGRCVLVDRPLGAAIDAAVLSLRSGKTPAKCARGKAYDFATGKCATDKSRVAALIDLFDRWAGPRSPKVPKSKPPRSNKPKTIGEQLKECRAELHELKFRSSKNDPTTRAERGRLRPVAVSGKSPSYRAWVEYANDEQIELEKNQARAFQRGRPFFD